MKPVVGQVEEAATEPTAGEVCPPSASPFIVERHYLDDGLVKARPHVALPLWIYNYTPACQYSRAWDDVTEQCRGLILDDAGYVVARPFRKFFNLEEHAPEKIPAESFRVYDELDGSLFIVARYDGHLVTATRGSFDSEQAVVGRQMLADLYGDAQFDPALTYLFEIIYPGNRIVVDYGNRRELVLLAAIETATGHEFYPEEIDLPMPKAQRFDGMDLDAVRAIQDVEREGFVLWFKSGFRAKVKFTEYKRLHRLLTQVSSKGIWELLRTGEGLGELLTHVPDEFSGWVREIEGGLRTAYTEIETRARREFRDLGDRRATAGYFLGECGSPSAVLFNMLDGKPYGEIIWKLIRPEYSRPFRTEVL